MKNRFGGLGQAALPLQQVKEAKQAKVTYYFGSMSPKAKEAKLRNSPDPNIKMMESINIEGATDPLIRDMVGSTDHPSEDTMDQHQPSMALVGSLVASGRAARNKMRL